MIVNLISIYTILCCSWCYLFLHNISNNSFTLFACSVRVPLLNKSRRCFNFFYFLLTKIFKISQKPMKDNHVYPRKNSRFFLPLQLANTHRHNTHAEKEKDSMCVYVCLVFSFRVHGAPTFYEY